MKKVISPKNLPTTLPTNFTLASYLFLDKFQVPEWAWGVWGTFIAIFWIVCIIGMLTQEYQTIFPE